MLMSLTQVGTRFAFALSAAAVVLFAWVGQAAAQDVIPAVADETQSVITLLPVDDATSIQQNPTSWSW